MNIQRLEILEKALRTLEETKQRFVMPEGKSADKFAFDFNTFGTLYPSCDTRACAFGLAALLPELRAQGLYYTLEPRELNEDEINMKICWTELPPERVSDSCAVAAAFFDVPYSIAYGLFLDGKRWSKRGQNAPGPATSLDVAEGIRYVIEHYADQVYDRRKDYIPV